MTVGVYISSLIQSAYFLSLFELVSIFSKQFNACKAYILLLHLFSQRVTLTRMRVRVTHLTYSSVCSTTFVFYQSVHEFRSVGPCFVTESVTSP